VDRPGAARRASVSFPPGMGFMFDLERGTATHDCGFVIPIADMIDRHGDFTDKPEEVVIIGMFMPPDSTYVSLDLRDLAPDEMVTAEELN
jgi:hypothetical protein